MSVFGRKTTSSTVSSIGIPFLQMSIGAGREESSISQTDKKLIIKFVPEHEDDESIPDLDFEINAKYVWTKSSATNNSTPLDLKSRLAFVNTICRYIAEYPAKSRNNLIKPAKMMRIKEDPDYWREMFTRPMDRTLVYYQMSDGYVMPEWMVTETGVLALDEFPDGEESYIDVMDWLTAEWLQLDPPEFKAFALANIVYNFVPSRAWDGFATDVYKACEALQDDDEWKACALKNIDEDKPEQAERLVSKLNTFPNTEMLRTWLHAAMKVVDDEALGNLMVLAGALDILSLNQRPRIPVPMYDRKFVDRAEELFKASSEPGGEEFKNLVGEFKDMFSQAGLPIRRSKRARQ